MVVAQNVISSLNTKQSPSGLRLLLLEDAPLSQETASLQYCVDGNQQLLNPLRPLHRHLISLCLHNPYWNDFRILNHFNRRNTPITMEDLQLLKAQCNLDDRETICNTLIRLSIQGGLKLNNRQISFIEKIKPEFRDRDLQSIHPGEHLVYKCLFGQGIGSLGRIYIHLFVDMFTGCVFGDVSRRRSLAVGLQILLTNIIPLYRAHNQQIHTISHSLPVVNDVNDINEFNQMDMDETFSKLGLQWQLVHRKFGVIEKFKKLLTTNQFLESAAKNSDSIAAIKPLFNRYLVNYNSSNSVPTERSYRQGT